MIKAIDKKYCIGDLVQLMPYTDSCHLIVNADEIILLKVGDKVLVNKYANHPSRNLYCYLCLYWSGSLSSKSKHEKRFKTY